MQRTLHIAKLVNTTHGNDPGISSSVSSQVDSQPQSGLIETDYHTSIDYQNWSGHIAELS